MSLQSLTPPQDITWKRMAFSRGMIDTNFGDLVFPPKWRSSLTVYYYIVPEEETADDYPESRIVYLKLSCSITGWNPSEELLEAKRKAAEVDRLDDLQNSIWEAVEASGWASKYWACHGAIMQLGIFPGKDENVGVEDYPFIMDFEPKKRELFEAFSEGAEILSASSDKTSLTKGSTSVNSTEKSVSAHASFAGFGGGASYDKTTSDTTVNQNTTDTSREARETLSRTTSGSQMYQLFNGYHLGTNRAVFVVSPRPHTITGSFNLIDGERKLEGIQEVFLVINMPRTLKGFCVQASIDTGHKNPEDHQSVESIRRTFALKTGEFSDPPCMGRNPGVPGDPGGGGGFGGGGGGGGGGTDPVDETGYSFIVTRRIVQSCGLFDEKGEFTIPKIKPRPERPPFYVGETFLERRSYLPISTKRDKFDAPTGGFDDCRETTVILYNHNLSRMSKSMLEIFSAGGAKPKTLTETNTFRTLYAIAANSLTLPLEKLLDLKYVTEHEHEVLKKYKVTKISDLFKSSSENILDVDLNDVRNRIVMGIKNCE